MTSARDDDRFEYLKDNLLLCAKDGSIDPQEVDDYVRIATHRIATLESELARVKAENAALRDATVIKPGETIVFVAPEHVSENGLLGMFGDFYGKHADRVIVLAHDWRTLPIAELRKLLAGAS